MTEDAELIQARLLVRKALDKSITDEEESLLLSWTRETIKNAPPCRDMGASHLEDLLDITTTQAFNLIRAAT